MMLFPYFLAGSFFGIVIVEAEVVSWFRIQEMFRFQSFHMYGIIGTAVLTAAVSLLILKKFGVRSLDGEPVATSPKTLGSGARYLMGGSIFGLGWALTGACPGPMVGLIGSGALIMLVPLAAALAGTLAYGCCRPNLPH